CGRMKPSMMRSAAATGVRFKFKGLGRGAGIIFSEVDQKPTARPSNLLQTENFLSVARLRGKRVYFDHAGSDRDLDLSTSQVGYPRLVALAIDHERVSDRGPGWDRAAHAML